MLSTVHMHRHVFSSQDHLDNCYLFRCIIQLRHTCKVWVLHGKTQLKRSWRTQIRYVITPCRQRQCPRQETLPTGLAHGYEWKWNHHSVTQDMKYSFPRSVKLILQNQQPSSHKKLTSHWKFFSSQPTTVSSSPSIVQFPGKCVILTVTESDTAIVIYTFRCGGGVHSSSASRWRRIHHWLHWYSRQQRKYSWLSTDFQVHPQPLLSFLLNERPPRPCNQYDKSKAISEEQSTNKLLIAFTKTVGPSLASCCQRTVWESMRCARSLFATSDSALTMMVIYSHAAWGSIPQQAFQYSTVKYPSLGCPHGNKSKFLFIFDQIIWLILQSGTKKEQTPQNHKSYLNRFFWVAKLPVCFVFKHRSPKLRRKTFIILEGVNHFNNTLFHPFSGFGGMVKAGCGRLHRGVFRHKSQVLPESLWPHVQRSQRRTERRGHDSRRQQIRPETCQMCAGVRWVYPTDKVFWLNTYTAVLAIKSRECRS